MALHVSACLRFEDSLAQLPDVVHSRPDWITV